jgi:tetratricopeptide (TPR) repeat protein
MPRTSRSVATVLLLSCASCGALTPSLDKEQEQRLTQFQSNAQLYYDGQRYDQSLDMVRKGLDLDPEDYKLLSIAGWCHLQLSERDPDQLVRAESYFDQVYDQRDPMSHMPHVLLGFAATKQRLGKEHQRLATTLLSEVESRDLPKTEQTIRSSRAEEHGKRARAYWDEAIHLLDILIEREDLLRFAHKLKMETYVEIGDYEKAVEHGELCLLRNADEQEIKNATIRETLVAAAERKARTELQELIDQEERVRSALAEMHYRKGDYAASLAQLDRLLSMDPTRSTDYYNRGRALQELGRIDEAHRDFEKFLGTTRLPSEDSRVAFAYEATRKRRP